MANTMERRRPTVELVGLFETMLRIRRFEERAGQLFRAGEIPGFVHLSIGQEAVAAGVMAALRSGDLITTTHRGHGHILAKGARMDRMMAELMGRETGYCRGKGGSMHIFDLDLGVLGANGILGAGQPIAVGAAMAQRWRGLDAVAVTFFGEGASAQGAVHEAMNLASLWSSPVVFVAELNGWAELTPYGVHVSVPSLTLRAPGYGMNFYTADGNDVMAVLEQAERAVEEARTGRPVLLELRTSRWRGHYEGDPQKYRSGHELAALVENDPLVRFKALLTGEGILDAEEFTRLDARVDAEVDDAVEFARTSLEPSPEQVLQDVYAGPST